ncbi:hypothetical protein FOCC_FOCC012979 [Frankliniella occidentalis]|nr:hypothetical protein FOCC_FOCC012979 [Frankliniella occidentalis]
MTAASKRRFPPLAVGDNVTVPIPRFDRGVLDARNALGIVLEVLDNGLFRVGTKHGVPDRAKARGSLFKLSTKFLTVERERAQPNRSPQALRTQTTAASRTGAQGYQRRPAGIRQLGMSKTAVHKIRRKDLNLKAWKRTQVQELTVRPGDVPLRARVCEELLDRVDVAKNNPFFPGDRFVNRVIWSDECTVSSEGHFNSQLASLGSRKSPLQGCRSGQEEGGDRTADAYYCSSHATEDHV